MDLASLDLGEFGKQLFLRLLQQTSTDGEFQELYQRCRKNDTRFVDQNFPASSHSLINNWDDDQVLDKVFKWKRFQWRRCEDFCGDKMQIFQSNRQMLWGFNDLILDKIEPADIKQGCLGDCYFLSVLSVLSQQPSRIRRLFITQAINDYGIYAVNICKNGQWRHVIIDDFFPCSNASMGPCFSKTHGDELWVLIMQKAWAKLHGSYQRIEAGLADNVFRDLTGAPCYSLSHDDDDLWANLLQANSQGFLMAASAGNTEASQALLESVGLIGQHSYGLLDIRDIDTKDGPQHLVKLRNPWGDFEWRGDWSDTSSNWTPDLQKELNFTNADDGTFWMSFADFCHYFSRVQICRYNENFKYVSYKCDHDKGDYSLIRMSVPEDSLQYITVSQIDKRTFPRNSKYQYSAARLIVAKLDEQTGEVEYIFGKMKVDRDLWEMSRFTAGQYLVYVEIDWKAEESSPFVLSAYGETEAYFIRDERYEHKEFLQRVYISCGKKNGKRIDFSSEGAPNCYKYTDMCVEGYGYVYFQNRTRDATLKENVTYTRFEGLQLVKPFKGTNYDVKVPPGENLIVLLRQSSPFGYNLSFSYSSTIVFTTDALKRQVKERGNRIARRDPRLNVELQIYVYTLKHGAGICYFYENLTKSRKLEETVRFKTSGLQIVGHKGTDVKVSIGPGESSFLELRALTPNWSIQTSVSYGIM